MCVWCVCVCVCVCCGVCVCVWCVNERESDDERVQRVRIVRNSALYVTHAGAPVCVHVFVRAFV